MPIVDGVDTKGDEKTVLPTRFLELENVVFTTPGSLRKRNGYEALPNKDLDLNEIQTGSALSSFRTELLQYSNSQLYSFSEGEQKWESKGEIKFCNSSSLQISADNSILENPNSYTYENVTCYAYERKVFEILPNTGLGELYSEHKDLQIVIVDNITNTILAKHDLSSLDFGGITNGSIFAPKVGFSGSKFIVAFMANFSDAFGGGLRFAIIDYLNPKNITISVDKIATASAINIVTDISTTTFRYDLQTILGKVYVAYTTTVLDTIVKSIDQNQDLSVGFSLGTSVALNNINISQELQNIRILISAATGSFARTFLINSSLTVPVHAAVDITAVVFPVPFSGLSDTDDGFYSITGCEDPNNPGRTLVFIQIKKWTTRLGLIGTMWVDSTGYQEAISSEAHIGLELQSKAISYNGYVYFFASKNIDPNYTASSTTSAIDADYQVNKPVRTLYLVKNLIAPSSSVKTELTGQYEVDENCFISSNYVHGLTNCALNGDIITKPSAVITSLQPAGANKVLASTVIKKQVADFSQTSNYFDVAQGEALHISGGLLKMYDGYKVVEHGFLDTPDAPKDIDPVLDLTTNPSLGVSLGNLRYLYCTVYKWTDRTGKIHRSSPSLPISLTTPAGTTKATVKLRFIPCYLTSKDNLEIEVYRTQGNGTIFYRLSKVVDTAGTPGTGDYITGSYQNNKEVKYIQILDTVTDQELAYAEPLYTTGGVLENDAALSSSFIASYKARIFLILSDKYTLQYSKVTGIGEPVRFNAAFKIPLDDKGGEATALAPLDDHLIIFKERAIFALTGEGPNELGQQDDYRTPYLITSDAGCIDPNSIVENPEGIMFKSAKGIYMLKRNFALQYIGDSVEKYNDEAIVAATLLSSVNQIRLITSSGVALVYDYYSGRWTTFSNIRGLDSIEFQGTYYYVKPNGLVYKETPGLFQDNGQFIKMRIKSAWIQISGVQGFERFYKMLLLGTYKSAHKLLVKFGYDFNTYYKQETLIDVDSAINPSVYGTGTYGTGVYGGPYPLYQWGVYPKQQKCQSFQFEIEDVKTIVDGESFSLSHIMAEIGVKSGGNKLPAGREYGAK